MGYVLETLINGKKLRAGDTLTVRTDLVIEINYGEENATEEMQEMAGMNVVVSAIDMRKKRFSYTFFEWIRVVLDTRDVR